MKKLLIILLVLVNVNSYSQIFDKVIDETLVLSGMFTIFYSGPGTERIELMDYEVARRELTVYSGITMVVMGTYIGISRNDGIPYTKVKKDWQKPLSITSCVMGTLSIMHSITYEPTEELYNKHKNNKYLDGKYAFDGIFSENERYLLTGIGLVGAGIAINKINFKHEFKNKKVCMYPNGIMFAYNF